MWVKFIELTFRALALRQSKREDMGEERVYIVCV